MSAALRLRRIEKRYRARGAEVVAIRDVDLDVRPDELVALIGPSGCGKSTVLKIVAGLSDATAGTALLDGKPITGPGPDRGVVFQHYALLPWMTVRENLRFAIASALGERDATETDRKVTSILRTVGLGHAADRRPRELSGGMQQRVGLARALVIQPKMLLLDEPFGALDALTRASLQDELLALWERRPMSALLITHDIEEALLLADRVAIMSRGPAATISRIVDIPFPRPRRRADVEGSLVFNHLRAELLTQLREELVPS
jgi:nitrate/nitrite transport system ATP-binding protein